MEHLAQVTRKTAPLGPTGQLLQKVTVSRAGDVADRPNIQKHTQGVSKNKEIRNTAQMEEQNKTPEIRTKQIGDKHSTRQRVHNTGYKDAQCALAGVAQWTECPPENQRVAGSIRGQGTCLGCRPGPWWGGT